MATSAGRGTVRALHRADELAAISAEAGRITRAFLTPEHRRANEIVARWMQEAGMPARTDAIGNVIGRREGGRPGLPALLLGSHLDTVRDAGRYDGVLGVMMAIECVDRLKSTPLTFAVEVIGFADEEGLRFGATLLGSRAVAGTFDRMWLDKRDASGVSLAQALTAFGLDPERIEAAARRPGEVLAYVEPHIEQGPVLEREGLPVGCVTSICGATRLSVLVRGLAGHAGTVPMRARRDALAAAAVAVLAVEERCAREPDVVGTVGCLEPTPGAVNVIPGECRFTVDVRAPRDEQRDDAVRDIRNAFASIGARRDVEFEVRTLHESAAVSCSPWLMSRIDRAIERQGVRPRRLPSGAGHDAMAMAALADVGMIFLRCKGGVSHHPAESVLPEDVEVGIETLVRFVADFEVPRDA